MRSTYVIMAAVAGLSLAAPASAQSGDARTYSRQLQIQIDAGVGQGTISRPEAIALREDLNRLVRLERQYSPNGIGGREHAVLMQRSNSLATNIRMASRFHNGRAERPAFWTGGANNGNYVTDPRFAGPYPGDRFIGDTRIGHHATARILNMPVQYRSHYIDNDRIYYGYDNGRVYQIDRRTRTIVALLDIVG